MICSKCGAPFFNCCDNLESCPECLREKVAQKVRKIESEKGLSGGSDGKSKREK